MHRILPTNLQNYISQLSYLPRVLLLVWKATRVWTIVWITLLIIQGLLPVATVYLTRTLVDSLLQITGKGFSWQSIQPVLLPATVMVFVLLLTEFIQGTLGWVRTAQSELVQDEITEIVHSKAIEVDLSFYESSDYYDRLNRATSEASGKSLSLLENSGGLLQNLITLLAMAAVLLPYGIWLPVLLIGSALPIFCVVVWLNRRNHRWWEKTTTDRRWLQYYELLITNSAIAAELRLFNLGPFFQSSYRQLRKRLRKERINLAKEQAVTRLAAGIAAMLISAFALLWVGQQLLSGLITLGDVALFYQAFNRGQGVIRSLLNSMGQIYSNSLFLKNLFEFFQLQSKIVDPPVPKPTPKQLEAGIQFEQVNFRYSGSDRFILKNFNLTIPSGKVVAIVGDNGAGKSTLVKLLCRFYDPESGSIKLDNIDLRQFSVVQLRSLITVLFQSPMPYFVTAAQNIALGDLSISPNICEIQMAAKGAGVHEIIERLPNGYETLMGKWFPGGIDLSGGEWQRLALARAFLRRAQLIVLDEPTSAMDPWAEADWLDRFRSLANGRTAIIITHRFTLAMRADIIHVMRQGEIVESGTHKELLAQGGLYAQSWSAQTQSTNVPPIEVNSIVSEHK